MAALIAIVGSALLSIVCIGLCLYIGISSLWTLVITVPVSAYIGWKSIDWGKAWEERNRKR